MILDIYGPSWLTWEIIVHFFFVRDEFFSAIVIVRKAHWQKLKTLRKSRTDGSGIRLLIYQIQRNYYFASNTVGLILKVSRIKNHSALHTTHIGQGAESLFKAPCIRHTMSRTQNGSLKIPPRMHASTKCGKFTSWSVVWTWGFRATARMLESSGFYSKWVILSGIIWKALKCPPGNEWFFLNTCNRNRRIVNELTFKSWTISRFTCLKDNVKFLSNISTCIFSNKPKVFKWEIFFVRFCPKWHFDR